jgi:Na+/H+ antiporter NhaC
MISLLPSLISLVIAFTTRNVLLSLFSGAFAGSLIINVGNPIAATYHFLEHGIIKQLANGSHLQIILVILIIAGFVELLDASGGAFAFANKIARYVNSKRKAQVATLFSGIAIFFTDSGNSLILGPLFRPIYHELKVCKEKLAYLLDSTSSPVCILVPFISWGLYIMGLIQDGHENIGLKVDSFDFYVAMYKYQFYPVLTLVFALFIALLGKDFFLMKKFQDNYTGEEEVLEKIDTSNSKARTIFIPLVVLFISIACLFLYNYTLYGKLSGIKLRSSLAISYSLAIITCVFILKRYGILNRKESLVAFKKGVSKMLTIPMILVFAWILGDACAQLGTAAYLSQIIKSQVPIQLLAASLFIIGAFTSFCTGSSWGTMAILMPMAIQIGHINGVDLPLMASAVLSGSLFGDHTSPISDTTLLASMASGSEHIDHVKTQLGYASIVGACSFVLFIIFA